MGQVNGLLPSADQLRREVYDTRRGHADLRGKPQVSADQAARPEHVGTGHPPPLVPEKGDGQAGHDEHQRDPQHRTAGIQTQFIHRSARQNVWGVGLTFALKPAACQGISPTGPVD